MTAAARLTPRQRDMSVLVVPASPPYVAISMLVAPDTQAWVMLDGTLTRKTLSGLRRMLDVLEAVIEANETIKDELLTDDRDGAEEGDDHE